MNFDRITVDPRSGNGQPCVRDLGLTVRRVVELLARDGLDLTRLRRDYPRLEEEDVRQALRWAAEGRPT